MSEARRCRSQRGSVAVETAVIAPALLILMLLVLFAGRVSEADGDVRRAASAAARSASLRQHPVDAEAAARDTAAANLLGLSCATLDTEVDTARFRAGGTVSVTVRCTTSMRDVSLLGVPGHRTFSARSVAVIDRYRGGEE